MVYVLILSVILNILLGYLIYANTIKLEKLMVFTQTYLTFIANLYFRYRDTFTRLKEVDRRGSFEADDEVGFIFKDIYSQLEELDQFIKKYVNQDEKKEEAR